MKKPRIVFVNRYFFPDQSATSQLLTDLAFHLSLTGYEVCVIASRDMYKNRQSLLAPHEVVNGVIIQRPCQSLFAHIGLPGRAMDYVVTYVAFMFCVVKMIRRGDFLVAKTDPPLLSVFLFPVAALRGARFVNWLQDIYPEIADLYGIRLVSLFAPVLAYLRNSSLRHADCNVVIGERMREKLIQFGAGKTLKKIENWCDDQAIQPKCRGNNILSYNWNLVDKFVVMYSGNLGLAHDYLTLLDAAEQLRDIDNLVFLFVGGGAQLAKLREEVTQRGLEAKFLYKPYQPEAQLNLSLGVADVHLVSLRPEMEGLIMPSKFYGACAAGRPVIFVGDRDGEVARLLLRYNCGFSVSEGDGKTLAKTILALRSNKELTACLGRNARAMIDADYSRKAALTAWSKIFAI